MGCRGLSFEGLANDSTVRVLALRSQFLTQDLAAYGAGVPGWFRGGTDLTVQERLPSPFSLSPLLLGTPLEARAEGRRRKERRRE